jgi:uncharacterized protein with FMN-binding domain
MSISCSLENITGEKNKKQNEKQGIQNKYKDGTYTEEGDKWKYGNENATIIINSGRIAGITLRRLDANGKEIRYEEWNGKNVNGSAKPNLNKFRVDLAQRMLEKQTYDVEIISGATISSNNWKRAVQRAIEKSMR